MNEKIYKPEEVFTIPTPGKIVIEGVPSHPLVPNGEYWKGMCFNMGEIICAVPAEQFRKAGYDARKVLPIEAAIKSLERNGVPLKVKVNYKPRMTVLEVDYSGTVDNICESLEESERIEEAYEASARLTSGNL